jgi:hypothetical protein
VAAVVQYTSFYSSISGKNSLVIIDNHFNLNIDYKNGQAKPYYRNLKQSAELIQRAMVNAHADNF